MSTKPRKASSKTGALRVEAVNAVIAQAIQNWVSKSAANLMGAPAELKPYQYRDKRGKIREDMTFVGENAANWGPLIPAQEPQLPKARAIFGRELPVQKRELFDASWRRALALELWANAKRRLLKTAKSAVMRYVQQTKWAKSYRALSQNETVKRLMDAEVTAALGKMADMVLPPKLRVGPQIISTSRTEGLPVFGFTSHGGKTAYRQFQGRPSLPEKEWIRRYRLRLLKRRVPGGYKDRPKKPVVPLLNGKLPKPRVRKPVTRQQGPTVPKTKFERPPQQVRLNHGKADKSSKS